MNAQTLEDETEAAILEPLQNFDVTEGLPPDSDDEPEKDQAERAWGDWRVRIGALFLARSDPSEWALNDWFHDDSPNDAANLNFPIGPASDVSLRLPGPLFDLDFRYFGVSQAVAGTGPTPRTLFVDPPRPFINVDSAGPTTQSETILIVPYETRMSLTSWLQSAEVNLSHNVHSNISLLSGFRYVQFREQLELPTEFLGIRIGRDMIARNELFGFQVGVEALILRLDRLKLEGAFKAGVLGNAASSKRLNSIRFQDWNESRSSDARRGAVTFLGDINLTVALQLTRRISLRGGYQLLWLAGVATATDQLPQSEQSWAALTTATDGSTFFHGAMVGLECGW